MNSPFLVESPAALTAGHLSTNARLFATRNDMVAALGPRRAGAIAEIGVAFGDFSDFMMTTLNPDVFVAFDTFEMHKWPVHWGRSSQEIFGDLTHLEFYKKRFAPSPTTVKTEEGRSDATLPRYPAESFDLIYVDGGHIYDDVSADARLSAAILKTDGLLIFNDYTLVDPLVPVAYGVVQAVNELIVAGGWQVVGFALERNMFCDIALKRSAPRVSK